MQRNTGTKLSIRRSPIGFRRSESGASDDSVSSGIDSLKGEIKVSQEPQGKLIPAFGIRKLGISFYFSGSKRNMDYNLPTKLIDKNFIDDYHKKILESYPESIKWLLGREYYRPELEDSVSSVGEELVACKKIYRNALLALISFQFVLGPKINLPIFTLGSPEGDKKFAGQCVNPNNKEYKFVVIESENSRMLIADFLLAFHAISDEGSSGVELVAGEVLERRGKDKYAVAKFLLIKIIYRINEKYKGGDIKNFVINVINEYVYGEEQFIKYVSSDQHDKYVDWKVAY